MIKNLFVLLAALCLISCNKTVAPPAWKIACYEFDQRQCNTDSWAKIIPLNLPDSEKKEKMMSFLESQGIGVVRVGLNPKFHEFTCEACDTCPYSHRFYLEMNDEDVMKLKRLRLLNLKRSDCNF